MGITKGGSDNLLRSIVRNKTGYMYLAGSKKYIAKKNISILCLSTNEDFYSNLDQRGTRLRKDPFIDRHYLGLLSYSTYPDIAKKYMDYAISVQNQAIALKYVFL